MHDVLAEYDNVDPETQRKMLENAKGLTSASLLSVQETAVNSKTTPESIESKRLEKSGISDDVVGIMAQTMRNALAGYDKAHPETQQAGEPLLTLRPSLEKKILETVESIKLKADQIPDSVIEIMARTSAKEGEKYCRKCKRDVTQLMKCTDDTYHVDTWYDM